MVGYTVTRKCAILFSVSLLSSTGVDVITFGPTTGNIIRVGSPLSINRKVWSTLTAVPQMLNTAQMFTSWLNRAHGGVRINGTKYLLSITLVDDEGTPGGVIKATKYLAEQLRVNLFLGPATSPLTEPAAALANSSGALMVTANAAAPCVFRGRQTVFGVLTAGALWPKAALNALAHKGMKTMGYIYENSNFQKALCSAIPRLAEGLGVTVVKGIHVSTSKWSSSVVDNVVLEMTAAAPDVVMVCAYEDATNLILQSMQSSNFTPGMVVGSVRPALGFQYNLRFVAFLDFWSKDSQHVSAWADGMTALDFAQNYSDQYGTSPTFFGACQWAGLEVLMQAIEKANSLAVDEITAVLKATDTQTLYGRVKFDIDNQNINECKVVQYPAGSERPIYVAPMNTDNFIYPMPRWEERECWKMYPNQSAYGFSADGICMECPDIARFNGTARYCYPCASHEEVEAYHIRTQPGMIPARRCVKRCQRGWATNGFGECFPCRPGHIALHRSCVPCPKGMHSNKQAQTECTICVPGTFGNATGQSTCRDCAVGTFSRSSGATTCRSCQEGSYVEAMASAHCKKCAMGTFSAVLAASACQLCPLTMTTVFEGAVTADSCTCKAGSYYDALEGACISCPWLHDTAANGATSEDTCTIKTDIQVALVGTITSMAMVFTCLFLCIRKCYKLRMQKLEAKEAERRQRTIDTAIQSITTLDHPMVLIRADKFLELGQLKSLENLRDQHELIFLDSLVEIAQFKESYFIMFFSHQWLGWGAPDPENVHYNAMSAAIHDVVHSDDIYDDRVKAEMHKWYVWCDFASISQVVRKVQILAILALPLYTCVANAFVIIAPTALHASSGKDCDIATYMSRGWCRLEVMAHLCRKGTKHMFMLEGSSKSVKPVTEEFLDNFDMCPFRGQFSCCHLQHVDDNRCDKEKLVTPMLGLYSLLLEQRGKPHIDAVLRRIEAQKAEFFPETFLFVEKQKNGKTCQNERELFASLITMIEEQETEAASQIVVKRLTRMESRMLGTSTFKCSLCNGDSSELCKVCGSSGMLSRQTSPDTPKYSEWSGSKFKL